MRPFTLIYSSHLYWRSPVSGVRAYFAPDPTPTASHVVQREERRTVLNCASFIASMELYCKCLPKSRCFRFRKFALLLLVAIICWGYSQFTRQREGNDRPDQGRLCSAVGQPIFEQRRNMQINSKNASENHAFNKSEGNDRKQNDQIPVGQIHDP